VPFSSEVEARLLDALFGGVPLSVPPTWWLGLSLAAISGQVVLEPAGANYRRVAIPNNNSYWKAAAGTSPVVKTNAAEVVFPLASGVWGIPVEWFLADAETGGQLWAHGPLAPESIGNGGRAGVPARQLVVSMAAAR
jgi:hypothetical protein